jgi:hypothetical protein
MLKGKSILAFSLSCNCAASNCFMLLSRARPEKFKFRAKLFVSVTLNVKSSILICCYRESVALLVRVSFMVLARMKTGSKIRLMLLPLDNRTRSSMNVMSAPPQNLLLPRSLIPKGNKRQKWNENGSESVNVKRFALYWLARVRNESIGRASRLHKVCAHVSPSNRAKPQMLFEHPKCKIQM